MKIRYFLVCTVFVLAGIRTHGQTSRGMSLSDLWEEAISNYPGLDVYRSRQRLADINQRLVRNQYLPDVYVQGQTSLGTQNAMSGSFFPLPGLYNINGSETGDALEVGTNIFGSILMDWRFLQFGRQKRSREAANIVASRAMHRLNAAQLSMQAEISSAYFRFLYHQAMERWAEKNAERVQAILQATRSRAKSGLSPGADSLLVNATLNQTAADLHLWQGKRAETKVELAKWVNLPENELSLIETSIVRAATRQSFTVDKQTHEVHPLRAFQDKQVAYAKEKVELATVAAFPSISLLAGAQLRGNSMHAEGSFYDNWQHSYNSPVHNFAIGFGLIWNFGDAFDSKLKKKGYQEEVRQAQAESEEVSLSLRSQAEMSRRQIMQHVDQVADAEQAYESAEHAYRLFKSRYTSGLISITELMQIQDVLQRTDKLRIETYYQYWIHQVDFAESTADFSYLQSQFK